MSGPPPTMRREKRGNVVSDASKAAARINVSIPYSARHRLDDAYGDSRTVLSIAGRPKYARIHAEGNDVDRTVGERSRLFLHCVTCRCYPYGCRKIMLQKPSMSDRPKWKLVNVGSPYRDNKRRIT